MKRVLIIDDSADVLTYVRDAVQLHGWEALTATDGEDGLKLAQEKRPDLILCDVQMPRMNGYEVLQKLRVLKETSTTPFVFITGEGEKPDMRHGMELGADDYLVKPFTLSELLGAIQARFKKAETVAEVADEKMNLLRSNLTLALPHELFTPLNSILGFAALLMESALPTHDVQECAGHIHAAARRLHRSVESFLFYAQLQVAASDPEQRKIFYQQIPSPSSVSVRSASERLAREHNREADLVMELADVDVPISPLNLDRIVRELVDNAFKFSNEGSSVHVKTARGLEGLHLQVTDNGRGIAPEQLGQIGAHLQFNRPAIEQQGNGLGLAIARLLAELHGGKLWLESALEKGTTAHVCLPAVDRVD